MTAVLGKQALKALREAADKVQTPSPASEPATATTPSAEDTEQSQVMLALGALLSSEPTAAVQVRSVVQRHCI